MKDTGDCTKRGRPDKYETHVEPYLEEVAEMAQTMTERQIAKALGIAYSTLRVYKSKYPAFNKAMEKGRHILIHGLRSALIKRAQGYEYEEVYETYEGTVLKEKTIKRKQMPPDVAAINLALKNYDPDNWANDPQMLKLRKDELRLRQKQAEKDQW